MMSFYEFAIFCTQAVKDRLPEQYECFNYFLTTVNVKHTGSSFRGLYFFNDEYRTPVINLDFYYGEYLAKCPVNELLNSMSNWVLYGHSEYA